MGVSAKTNTPGSTPADPRAATRHGRTALWIERCTLAVARDAVERWHYTRSLPCITSDNHRVTEGRRHVGVIVFGPGPAWGAQHLGVERHQFCELMRVSLGTHRTPTSRAVAIALRLLQRDRSGLRVVLSYADTAQGHHGGIYQAGGWLYLGSTITHRYRVNGKLVRGRSLGARYGVGGQSVPWLRAHLDPAAERVPELPKHKYVFPLDGEVRGRLAARSRPYPKRDDAQLA